MARYEIKPLPKNTAVIPVNGRFYPVKLTWADQGLLQVQSFVTREGLPVSYSKRYLAGDFLEDYQGGRVDWAIPAEKTDVDAARPA